MRHESMAYDQGQASLGGTPAHWSERESVSCGPMKIKRRSQSPLNKKARRGFRGYPVATVAFYGPDNTRATKVAVAIMASERAKADPLRRWFSEDVDVRHNPRIGQEILGFVQEHGARSVVMTEGIIGCPHEEGIDYPEGEVCPRCPFWAGRDRWTGEYQQ